MMNSLAISKGKALAFLIFLSLFIVQGCRKDIIQPNSGVLKNSLSIAEAKAYFDANLRQGTKPEKLMATSVDPSVSVQDIVSNKQALWDQAYQKIISGANTVKIPLDFGGAQLVLSGKIKATIPYSSLNYLIMYKDSLQKINAEWVNLLPDSAWLYGDRTEYTGTIIVKNWNGLVINKFKFNNTGLLHNQIVTAVSKLSSVAKLADNETTNNDVSSPGNPICFRFTTGKCPKLRPCTQSYCDYCLAYCAKEFCSWQPEVWDPNGPNAPTGGGGSGPAGPGGGGGGAYPPDLCPGGSHLPVSPTVSSDNVNMTVPVDPCIPKPIQLKLDMIANFLSIIDADKQNFLLAHNDIYDALVNYLVVDGDTPENKEFVDWAVGYLTINSNINFNDFMRDVFEGPDQSFNDSDADNNYTSMNLTNIGNATFTANGYDIYTPTSNLPDYGPNHPVSQAVYNFNPWIYYAFLGANNTSLAHFHLTTKGLDSGDGYRKAIGTIGEGLFVSRLTLIPTSPPANIFVAKMFGTTHIDALVVRNIPFIGGSGYEIAINYTDLNGNYKQLRMHHPDGLTAGPIRETTIAYEVKTFNAKANTPESLYRMLQEGIKQTRHRANIQYMSAAVLVFDDQAWNKLKSSSFGPQAINDVNSMSSVKNSDGEQKIFFRIEKGLSQDANRAFFALKDRIKNL